jgi:16S rRNA (cytosine967-C5)-methyltransferase
VSAEKPRQIAARVLQRHAAGSDWLESVLDAELAESSLAPVDRAIAQELAFGVLRWQAALDWLIARKTAGRTQKNALQILLRLGLYQLFWLDRIPDHAAVHETVQLARELGCGPQAGFVNALLRGCLRERETLERDLEELKASKPHTGYSHPEWLCRRWEKRWGSGKLRALLAWNNTPPAVFVRVNTLKTTPEELARQFEKEGVLFTPRSFDWIPNDLVFELRSHPPLVSLPSFQQGAFYVQDPSTLLAVRELDSQPGEGVLDLCAAPGGKATFIAQLMRNEGRVVANEPSPPRRKLMEENCQRLGVSCVEISDSFCSKTPGLVERFDRVLVDAPCSNTGVMRRRVDLRYRLQPPEIERLTGLQLKLLHQAADQLKPGGTLIYSTCSLEPEENGDLVKKFLSGQKEFRLTNERQLTPFADGVDGAYVSALQRG